MYGDSLNHRLGVGLVGLVGLFGCLTFCVVDMVCDVCAMCVVECYMSSNPLVDCDIFTESHPLCKCWHQTENLDPFARGMKEREKHWINERYL